MKSFFLSLVAIAHAQASVVSLPAGMSWANLAWGFENGGSDSTQNAAMVLLDPDNVSTSDIANYKAAGKTVLCYLSVGTIEKFRQDYKDNQAAWDAVLLGKMADWDETWIDIRKADAVLPLLGKRLDKLQAKGCQGVEPDNIDCYGNEDCWKNMNGITSGDQVQGVQVSFLRRVADAAHNRNMAIVIKNAVSIVADLSDTFDGAVSENCLQFNECDVFQKYIVGKGKAHFAVEYGGNSASCNKAYPGMVMKYCASNSDRNLCSASVKQWKQCPSNYSAKPTTTSPTKFPTSAPTSKSTTKPTSVPTVSPTKKPTTKPTSAPSVQPTTAPVSECGDCNNCYYGPTNACFVGLTPEQCATAPVLTWCGN
ncbi:hypothetical protein LEN26_015341 [Aphanomyces euteiches]|nr:hypothetical protein LEN26_015341 [Aphanomyces euteiches]KAH9103781.1 hypothetical protein AeMF1_019964 [Aphanomyces euteiches]KAH9181771.1 hypothetical protein AeNC1_016254 [Aphanomyces euteiches]